MGVGRSGQRVRPVGQLPAVRLEPGERHLLLRLCWWQAARKEAAYAVGEHVAHRGGLGVSLAALSARLEDLGRHVELGEGVATARARAQAAARAHRVLAARGLEVGQVRHRALALERHEDVL